MKKFLMVLAFFAVVSTASAQSYKSFRMGPKVGMNVAGITHALNYRTGFTAGIVAEYTFFNWFALSGDILFSQQGSRERFDDGILKLNLNYINIPIMANFFVTDKLALKIGLQPGVLVMARGKLKNSDYIAIAKIRDEFNVFDFSIPVGISYDFRNSFRVEVRYNYSLTEVFPRIMDENEYKNSVITITVGWLL